MTGGTCLKADKIQNLRSCRSYRRSLSLAPRSPSRQYSMSAVSVTTLFLLVIGLPRYAQSELSIVAELSYPAFSRATAIDAQDDIVFIAGAGIAAVDAREPRNPRLLNYLQDERLFGCADIYSYVNSWGSKRLAAACTESLVLVDVEHPAALNILGSITSPDLLRASVGVVVRDKLAFIAISDLNYIISFDISIETRPSLLSFVRLSAVASVALYGDNAILVTSGGRVNRMTILSYTPSGVFMKLGSVKDGRLSGDVSVAQEFPLDPNFVFVVSSANGGTFAVVNTTTRTRPVLQGMIQSNGRYAAGIFINQPSEEWSPNGHKQLDGAGGFCIAPNGIAYIFAARAKSISAVFVNLGGNAPNIAQVVCDDRLNGVIDISCDGSVQTRAGSRKDEDHYTNANVIYALNARSGRFLVLLDGIGGGDEPYLSYVSESKWEF